MSTPSDHAEVEENFSSLATPDRPVWCNLSTPLPERVRTPFQPPSDDSLDLLSPDALVRPYLRPRGSILPVHPASATADALPALSTTLATLALSTAPGSPAPIIPPSPSLPETNTLPPLDIHGAPVDDALAPLSTPQGMSAAAWQDIAVICACGRYVLTVAYNDHLDRFCVATELPLIQG